MDTSGLLTLQIAFFVLLAVGFVLKRTKVVTEEGQRDITNLVMNVVLPCNILASFLTGASMDVLRDCSMVALISAINHVFWVFYGRVLFAKKEDAHRRCLEYGILCPNAGFLGNAIAEGTFGSLGLMYASVYLVPARIVIWTEGVSIFTGERDWHAMLKNVATHPCILACAIGIPCMLTGVSLPTVILTPVQYLGRCNTALSMLVVGMILEGIDLKTIVDKEVLQYIIHRLIMIPLLVYLLCTCLCLQGAVRGVCVLLAAMPAGATTTMLAAKYNCVPEFATKLVFFSTLCSIPAILTWCIFL